MSLIPKRESQGIWLLVALCLLAFSIISFNSVWTIRPGLGLDATQTFVLVTSVGFICALLSLLIMLAVAISISRTE